MVYDEVDNRNYSAIIRLFPYSFIIGYFIISGYRKKSLSYDGMIMALIVAIIHAYCSQTFTILLLGFYLSSSKLTKFKSDIKKKLEDQHQEGGNRNFVQVLSNSLPATLFSILYHLSTIRVTTYIDYNYDFYGSFLCVGVLAHYACCNGDTWASELGILSKSDPILITNLKRVPKGTNGGVSTLGLSASCFGGLFIGILYYLGTIITGSFYPDELYQLNTNGQLLPVLILSTSAGLFGSLLDSLLGATLQKSVWSEKKKVILSDNNSSQSAFSNKEDEIAENNLKHISGKEIFDNHQINLLSSFLTAIIFGLIGNIFFF